MVWEGNDVLTARQGVHWVLGVINLLEESFAVYDSNGGRHPLALVRVNVVTVWTGCGRLFDYSYYEYNMNDIMNTPRS